MWAMKRGLDTVLKPPEVESIIVGMQRHFAKHAYYVPHAFELIWAQMQTLMPMATRPTPDGVVYPIVEMLTAATLAGYPLDPMIGVDYHFGIFVAVVLGDLGKIARVQASQMQ